MRAAFSVFIAVSFTALGFVAGRALAVGWTSEVWAFVGAAAGAIIALLGSYWISRHQISEQRSEVLADRRRRLSAARAIFASDLSAIVEHTEACSQAISKMVSGLVGREVEQTLLCPKLGSDVLLRLQHLIELLEPADADQVADLLNVMQVQHSRLSGQISIFNHRSSAPVHCGEETISIDFALKAVVEVHLRAVRAFRYARRQEESIAPPPFDENEINSAFWRLAAVGALEKAEREDLIEQMKNMPSSRWKDKSET